MLQLQRLQALLVAIISSSTPPSPLPPSSSPSSYLYSDLFKCTQETFAFQTSLPSYLVSLLAHGLCHRLNVKCIHTHFPVIWLTYKYESSAFYLCVNFVRFPLSNNIIFSHCHTNESVLTPTLNGILLLLLELEKTILAPRIVIRLILYNRQR